MSWFRIVACHPYETLSMNVTVVSGPEDGLANALRVQPEPHELPAASPGYQYRGPPYVSAASAAAANTSAAASTSRRTIFRILLLLHLENVVARMYRSAGN